MSCRRGLKWSCYCFIFRHSIQEIWGANVLYFNIKAPVIYEYFTARFTSFDFIIISSSVFLVLFLHVFLTYTNLGKSIRATSDNPNLSLISGIDTDRVIYTVWFLSGGTAGFAGFLRGIDTRLSLHGLVGIYCLLHLQLSFLAGLEAFTEQLLQRILLDSLRI